MKELISKESLVACPWCRKESTAEEWDKVSYEQCLNREQRRDYISIIKKSSWKKDAKLVYMCPICKKWARSNTLYTVDSETKEKLGGDSIIILNNENSK